MLQVTIFNNLKKFNVMKSYSKHLKLNFKNILKILTGKLRRNSCWYNFQWGLGVFKIYIINTWVELFEKEVCTKPSMKNVKKVVPCCSRWENGRSRECGKAAFENVVCFFRDSGRRHCRLVTWSTFNRYHFPYFRAMQFWFLSSYFF